jgi:ABC-type transport system involved in multi-copper enzyme maturation permease subunit
MSPLANPPLTVDRSDVREATARQGGGFTGLLWLTWRQHRWALIGSLVLAAVLTGWMLYLAADMTTLHHQCHDKLCASGTVQDAELNGPYGPVAISHDLLRVVQYLPLLIGVFIGVPMLAREHEQRTLLLAWSQDVSPLRWLWTKLALLGLVVAALTAAASAAADHLAHVVSQVTEDSLFDNFLFLNSGMLPLALGVSWFAVGVAVGAATRRVLPAAIAAVVGFVGFMLLVRWRYPTLETPLSRLVRVGAAEGPALGLNTLRINGNFMISPNATKNLYDSSGHPLSAAALRKLCPDPGRGTLFPCMTRHHVETLVRYQPAGRIPIFHLIVASGYLGVGALAVLAVWLIARRTSLSAG